MTTIYQSLGGFTFALSKTITIKGRKVRVEITPVEPIKTRKQASRLLAVTTAVAAEGALI